MSENFEKVIFENDEVIENMECGKGEDNDFIDPLEDLEGADE